MVDHTHGSSPRKLGEGEHPLEFEAEDVAAFWIGGEEDDKIDCLVFICGRLMRDGMELKAMREADEGWGTCN